MAFKKGQGGRPKGAKNLATVDVRVLIDKLAGPGAEKCFDKLASIALGAHDDIKARLVANRTLIEYRHGRPKEQVELTGTDGGPVRVQFVDA